jgi:hypothetical protein
MACTLACTSCEQGCAPGRFVGSQANYVLVLIEILIARCLQPEHEVSLTCPVARGCAERSVYVTALSAGAPSQRYPGLSQLLGQLSIQCNLSVCAASDVPVPSSPRHRQGTRSHQSGNSSRETKAQSSGHGLPNYNSRQAADRSHGV